jgi:protein TonB
VRASATAAPRPPAPEARAEAAAALGAATGAPGGAAPGGGGGANGRSASDLPGAAAGGGGAGAAHGWMPRGRAQPAPAYPDAARRAGAEGTAQVALRLAASGRVSEVRLHRTSGDARLDRAALAAVRRWRFAAPPGGADWRERWFLVPIEFRLR